MNEARLERGHRWFAYFYSRFIANAEQKQYAEPRQRLMEGLRGRVVEIGAGSGANFSYYPAGVQIEATEPDPHMLKRARARAAELRVTNITVQQAPAEKLPSMTPPSTMRSARGSSVRSTIYRERWARYAAC